MRGILCCSLLLSFALPVTVLAQRLGDLRLGDTVRVWARQPPLRKAVGTFVGAYGDTLSVERRYERRVERPGYFVMRPTVDTVQITWSSLERLDVRDGVSAFHGALKGLAWGSAIGAAVGIAWSQVDETENAYLALIFFPSFGTAVGTLLGTVMGSERWRRVYDRD